MKKMLLVLVSLLAWKAEAIGLQHGLFQSQATQGPKWLGTAAIRSEKYTITVNPDYLDVELDWEFEVGGVRPAEHADALEIVGNINLEKNSVVTGMLVWYKDKILKGKLKTTAHARKEYEEVVDRNSPVPPKPRDPVLLEWIRQDNYDISIFPVEWGGTRKVRIRYLVPAQNGFTGYPHAFSDKARVIVKRGPGVKGFWLNTTVENLRFSDLESLELGRNEFEFRPYATSTKPKLYGFRPILEDERPVSKLFLGGFSGAFSGQVAHFFLVPPSSLLAGDSFPRGAVIEALIRSGSDSCRKIVGTRPGDSAKADLLRIYSQDSLLGEITWRVTVAGVVVHETVEAPEIHRAEDGLDYARTFGGVPFYPMTTTMPRSMGVALGFIDTRYSLVALESDALPDASAAEYREGGVPTLAAADIFPEPDEVYDMPLAEWLGSQPLDRQSTQNLLRANSTDFTVGTLPGSSLPAGIRSFVKDGRLHVEISPELIAGGQALECAIHTVSGKLVRRWTRGELRSGRLTWTPERRQAGGIYLLKLQVGKRSYSQPFHIPG